MGTQWWLNQPSPALLELTVQWGDRLTPRQRQPRVLQGWDGEAQGCGYPVKTEMARGPAVSWFPFQLESISLTLKKNESS